MIVATAGHIDHGKTSLVRALTGVDADRLPEEKRRGLTIDLGFAYLPLPDGTILGFVDVPGHEKFVRNMLAGVGGIDFGLLVVAADDGVMPQTREHLAILDLLQVPRGAVAITKVDRVPEERRRAVENEVAALLKPTVLAEAPLFPLSSTTGAGVPELAAHLTRTARAMRRAAAGGGFRLAVDRCFTLHGTGIVVTGTAFAGSVRVGDRLLLSPAGHEVRVRGIHAQNRETHAARAGERCALNIAGTGLSKDAVHRGDWLVAADLHAPTDRLDAVVRLLPDAPAPLRDRTPMHLHLGAADVTARVSPLAGRRLEAGERGLVRLQLDRPIGALAGDRFVLRDQSAQHTVGGGYVLDPAPPLRGARRPERLALLGAFETNDATAALAGALDILVHGLALAPFLTARNLSESDRGALLARVPLVRIGEGDAAIAFAPAHWDVLRSEILRALGAWHERHPDSPGPDPRRLRIAMAGRPPVATFDAALAALVKAGDVRREAGWVRLPGHEAQLSSADAKLWARIEPLLDAAGLRPPRVREIAEALGLNHEPVTAALRRLARMGIVMPVADNRFFPPRALVALAHMAREAADADGGSFTAAQFKDRTGIGRNVTIQLLEFFDARGLTRREGDRRRIVGAIPDLFPDPDAPASALVTGAADTASPGQADQPRVETASAE
ncbi:selenocysteine-specific elongation factor [Constrictibacter sp. MBR-5]|jgi:selenocysteine-specific elongation factor|uniref:selenocysteine-specific translation elongation factor n=1 Tax=Constrictibacter sp. MBR-5 TaxID=3156467 RepID=UPI003394742E